MKVATVLANMSFLLLWNTYLFCWSTPAAIPCAAIPLVLIASMCGLKTFLGSLNQAFIILRFSVTAALRYSEASFASALILVIIRSFAHVPMWWIGVINRPLVAPMIKVFKPP